MQRPGLHSETLKKKKINKKTKTKNLKPICMYRVTEVQKTKKQPRDVALKQQEAKCDRVHL